MIEQRLIVRTASDETPSGLRAQGWRLEPLLARAGGVWLARREEVFRDPTEAFETAYAVTGMADVIEAEPDLPVAVCVPVPTGTPATDAATDWWLEQIRLPEAWSTQPTPGGSSLGTGVRVGHPDTGYTFHPMLRPGLFDLRGARDILRPGKDPEDPLVRLEPFLHPSHGTSTAALIAGGTRTSPQGAAPGAKVVPMRCVLSVVQVLDSDVARAVDASVEAECAVVSVSLGGAGFIGLREACARARDAGAIVVAAAGNNITWVCPPAVYPETVAVGGTDARGMPWAGSGRGEAVDVAGPAADITVPGWDAARRPPVPISGTWSGTSFATALVAGVAALWVAHHGERVRALGPRTTEAFRTVLTATARRPAGWDRNWGEGVVDAAALLRAPLPEATDLSTGASRLRPDSPLGPLDDPLLAMEAAYLASTADPSGDAAHWSERASARLRACTRGAE